MKLEAKRKEHRVSIGQTDGVTMRGKYGDTIKNTVLSVLRSESVATSCEVNVLITDNDGIRAYNRTYRGIDKPTDVLSFPMQEVFRTGGNCGQETLETDKHSGVLPLGDIVLSARRVKMQARKYAHTIDFEIKRLIVHSMLHLLGYDHDSRKNEREMRKKEKTILRIILHD